MTTKLQLQLTADGISIVDTEYGTVYLGLDNETAYWLGNQMAEMASRNMQIEELLLSRNSRMLDFNKAFPVLKNSGGVN